MIHDRYLSVLPLMGATTGAVAGQGVEPMLATPDAKLIFVGLFGIIAGILARVGVSIKKEQTKAQIMRDLLVSLLGFMANFSIVIFVAQQWQLSYTGALVVSVIVAFSGLAVLNVAEIALHKRLEDIFGKKNDDDKG